MSIKMASIGISRSLSAENGYPKKQGELKAVEGGGLSDEVRAGSLEMNNEFQEEIDSSRKELARLLIRLNVLEGKVAQKLEARQGEDKQEAEQLKAMERERRDLKKKAIRKQSQIETREERREGHPGRNGKQPTEEGFDHRPEKNHPLIGQTEKSLQTDKREESIRTEEKKEAGGDPMEGKSQKNSRVPAYLLQVPKGVSLRELRSLWR